MGEGNAKWICGPTSVIERWPVVDDGAVEWDEACPVPQHRIPDDKPIVSLKQHFARETKTYNNGAVSVRRCEHQRISCG